MTSTGIELNTTQQLGQDFTISLLSLPQKVDVCTLRVRISAGNSAGMSSLSEAVEVGEFYYRTRVSIGTLLHLISC